MGALIGVFLTRHGAAIAAVAGAMAVAALFFWQAHGIGRREALQSVERANRASEGRADAAEQRVLTCPPGLWDRERRICATKLH